MVEREISFKIEGKEIVYSVRKLPRSFISWQSEARKDLLNSMLRGEDRMLNFGAHLPVMSTKDAGVVFPTNSCVKGVGLLPTPTLLDKMIKNIEMVEEEIKKDRKTGVKGGIKFLIDFYSDVGNLDWTRLSSIEIYAKKTFRNVKKDPRVSLLYADLERGCLSYMVNAVVEIVGEDNPYYKFVCLMHDIFHIPKNNVVRRFPAVYIFHVCELYNKTPGKNASRRLI
ncbi:MAG: pyridoxamine 5'-phosphate oxidase family protein [bacterium]